MTPETQKSPRTADRMTSVKSAGDKAAAGPKRDGALTHYQQAAQVHTAQSAAQTHTSLAAAISNGVTQLV